MISSSSRPGWHKHAACKGLDPELFFPERGKSNAEAIATCAGCPVRAECLEAGRLERYGIWGGLSFSERRKAASVNPIRKCWLCGGAVTPPDHYCSDTCRAVARRGSNHRWRRGKAS